MKEAAEAARRDDGASDDLTSSGGGGGAMSSHHLPEQHNQQQPQLQTSGGIIYNNLIPGHYRYNARPAQPPPGPLSYSNISNNSQTPYASQRQATTVQQHHLQNTGVHSSQDSLTTVATSYYQTAPDHYHAQHEQLSVPKNSDYINISEPADEEDDDILLVAAPEIENDAGEAAYYRPFRYAVGSRLVLPKKNGKKTKGKEDTTGADVGSEPEPLDLLAALLSGPVGDSTDIARMIEDATEKSIEARNLTRDLARRHSHLVNDKQNADEGNDEGNHAYAAASNCHAEAAFSYQKVYRTLLGLSEDCSYPNNRLNRTATLSPSEELAKSMLILASAHASRAKSLGTMGEKWNLGKVKPTGWMIDDSRDAKSNDGKIEEVKSTSSNESSERLRACVRGALETHEADITASTFLARSVTKESARSSNRSDFATKDKIEGAKHGTCVGGNNPVDDL